MLAMFDLALHYGEGLVLVKDVAKRQKISQPYLEHLLLSLKVSGLVRSGRGSRGGFTLTRPPSQIRLGEIIQALEGSISPVECIDNPEACSRTALCVTRDTWVKMKRAISEVLDSTTLQDLVEQQEKTVA